MAAAAQSQPIDAATTNIGLTMTDHQYRIVAHVILPDPAGSVVDMVKAYNRHGRLMYIHLDAVGCLSDQGVTKMMISSVSNGNKIPLAMKENLITMMDHTVRGVVCEQQDGLAIMRRNTHGDLVEQMYHYTTPLPEPVFMCYPLINYSDMKVYPQLVSEQCADSSDRMQHSLLSQYCCKLGNLNKSIVALNELWQHYLVDNRKYIDTLLERLRQLRAQPQGCDDRLIREEIARSEALLCKYLNGLDCVTSLQCQIDQVGSTIYREKKQLDRSAIC